MEKRVIFIFWNLTTFGTEQELEETPWDRSHEHRQEFHTWQLTNWVREYKSVVMITSCYFQLSRDPHVVGEVERIRHDGRWPRVAWTWRGKETVIERRVWGRCQGGKSLTFFLESWTWNSRSYTRCSNNSWSKNHTANQMLSLLRLVGCRVKQKSWLLITACTERSTWISALVTSTRDQVMTAQVEITRS